MRMRNGIFKIFGLLAVAAFLLLPLVSAQAETFSGRVQINVTGTYSKAGDLSTAKDRLEKAFEQLFTNGTGSGQANKQFHDARSLEAGANESLDLAGGLTDTFGNSLTFTKIKFLLIANTSTTQTLSVGGGGVNSFINWVADATDIVKIGPGATAVLICDPAGVTVTADTGDLLKILNNAGAACIYDIVIFGN